MKFLPIIALLIAGCATPQAKPPTRTASIEWRGIRIAYELPVTGWKK